MSTDDTRMTDLWWAFLVGSLERISARLTKERAGIVQFEITESSGETSYRFLELRPGMVRGHLGRASRVDESVKTSEAAIAAILMGSASASDALQVQGGRALLRSALHQLQSAEPPRRALYFRGQP